MKAITAKQLWFYPILFGFLGAALGLILRYAFAEAIPAFPLKNLLHSHSHVMLLGLLFNALIVLLWSNFSKGIDGLSFRYYIALQVCVAAMLVTFIIQGYALHSILFSTLHLWLSYILLIRLWKRLEGNKQIVTLIKIGIVFHFISSIGPYCLGPLMAMDMQDSPWYQQAIFFYLHFQYFGSLFVWLLAGLLKRTTVILKKKHLFLITFSLICLYAHSLDYNFNHWSIRFFGGLGSILLFILFLNFKRAFLASRKPYRSIYLILIIIAFANILGSIPQIAHLVEDNRFILIAWLHLLFLGLFIPFIWVELPQKIGKPIWISYGIMLLFSEAILLFPTSLSQFFSTSVMWLLFAAYLGVFLSISIVHLTYLFKSK